MSELPLPAGAGVAEESESQKIDVETSAKGAGAALPQSEDHISALWHRLKEHRIAQWAVGYVALMFAIQHAVTLRADPRSY